jgi:hypothetical protein
MKGVIWRARRFEMTLISTPVSGNEFFVPASQQELRTWSYWYLATNSKEILPGSDNYT